jgi:hypothetical protein
VKLESESKKIAAVLVMMNQSLWEMTKEKLFIQETIIKVYEYDLEEILLVDYSLIGNEFLKERKRIYDNIIKELSPRLSGLYDHFHGNKDWINRANIQLK